jgi:hypothetical protein
MRKLYYALFIRLKREIMSEGSGSLGNNLQAENHKTSII